jgi:vancomycin resistance protein YoaR
MPSLGSIVGTRSRRVGLAVALAIIAIPIIGSLVEHAVYSGEVLPGVQIDGIDVAGKSKSAAYDEIARVGAELARTPIRAHAGVVPFAFDPGLIGYSVDAQATVREAQTAGRTGNPAAIVAGSVLRRFRDDDVPLVVDYDHVRFEGLLDGWSNALDRGLVEGNLRFVGTKVVPVEPHAGTGLVRDEASRRLADLLSSVHRSDLDLPVGAVQPRVDAAQVAAAAARARALLVGNHVIVAGRTRATLTPGQLARTLGTRIVGSRLDLTVDPNKLRVALGPAIAPFSVPAVDASFAVTSQNTVQVVPSRDGRVLDLDAVGKAILRGDRTIVADVHRVHPTHDTAWAKKLGITRQVSSFTTYHPAGQPRVNNIHVAADVLNNSVVEPGQTFSLNEKLGPRTEAKGYVKAPILVEDGFGEDFGGGVSQLTTTLYNAVFFGGYEDVSHTTHTFYISRYPMGREATVNYPSIDLKFRDDTSHGVLIRTYYSDTSITVALYGDNDGRSVREENRRAFNPVPITDQLITCPAKPEIDPTNLCAGLSALERTTLATGEPGWDVEFDRVIDQPGRAERRHHYRVHYPMLRNKILVGTTPATSTTSTTKKGRTTTTTAKSTPTTKPRSPVTPTT